jgi:hypothetical protein
MRKVIHPSTAQLRLQSSIKCNQFDHTLLCAPRREASQKQSACIEFQFEASPQSFGQSGNAKQDSNQRGVRLNLKFFFSRTDSCALLLKINCATSQTDNASHAKRAESRKQ